MPGFDSVTITGSSNTMLASSADSQNFANLAALKASTVPPAGVGRLVFLTSRHAWFAWDETSTLTTNDIDVVTLTASATGRYIRLSVTHRLHQLTPTWYLDPTSGDDDNNGTSSGTALKSPRELNARLAGFMSISITVNVLNNLSATDPISLTAFTTLDYVANANSISLTLTIAGTRTQVRTGTISARTVPDPATNTPGEITDAGATWATSISSDYLGVMTSGAANGNYFWAAKDNGASSARINTPVSQFGAAGSFPAVNDTYTEYSLTTGVVQVTTNASLVITNWRQSSTTTGFLLSPNTVSYRVSAVGNLQSVFAPNIAVSACKDGTSSALSVAVPGRVQYVGCTFHRASILSRANCYVNVSSSLLQGVGITAGGTATISPGNITVTTTGVMDVSGTAFSVQRGSVALVNATLWGASNTTGFQVLTGGEAVLALGVTPTLTGTTEISIDGMADLFGNLEQYSGVWDATTVVAPCTTWAELNAAPFTRNAIGHKTGAKIISA